MDALTDVLLNMGVVGIVVEALKRILGPRFDSDRYGLGMALVVGIGVALGGVALDWYDAEYGQAILGGLLAGGSVAGFYGGTKDTVRGMRSEGS